jgi:hypothetical protein
MSESNSGLITVPDFFSKEECDSFLKEIHQGIQQHSAEPVSETNSFLMRWGSVFFKQGYGKSKRKLFPGDFIDRHTPSIKKTYYHKMPSHLSSILQRDVYCLPLRGSLNCLIMMYTDEGEFMDWHKDATLYNYNENKVFTCLVCLENTSNQQLCIKDEKEEEEEIKCHDYKEGTLYIFEQFEVNHAILPKLQNGHKRVMLSFTFAQEPYHTTFHGYIWDHFKYMANNVNMPLYWSPPNRMIALLLGLCLLFLVIIFVILFVMILVQFFKSRQKKNNPPKIKKNKL